MTRLVGIDPGVQPALALKDTDTGEIELFDETAVKMKHGRGHKTIPQAATIAARLHQWRPDLVVLEAVQPIKGQGLVSSCNFMRAAGLLEGVCAGLGLSYELVRPQQWQKDLRMKRGPDASYARVLEMYPSLAPQLKRKKDHNRASALLLAIWAERTIVPVHPLFCP